jgi:hypothetical protein
MSADDIMDVAEAVGVVAHPKHRATGTYLVITHPTVTVARATLARHVARCHHCPHELTSTSKRQVQAWAKWHRAQHQAGNLPVILR